MLPETRKEPNKCKSTAFQEMPRAGTVASNTAVLSAVATAEGADIQEQTRRSLEFLMKAWEWPARIKPAFSRTNIFADMSQKADMDVAGTNGLGRTGTIGRRGRRWSPLAPGTLVEIVLDGPAELRRLMQTRSRFGYTPA